MLRTYYRHSSCPLAGLLVMMMIGACSGSSDTNGGASDPTAFGQKYKLADNEIGGWKQTTDPTDSMPFGVYTDANLTIGSTAETRRTSRGGCGWPCIKT